MTRVVFGTNYPMGEAGRLVEQGVYPSQHLWGVPALRAAGHDVEVVSDDSLRSAAKVSAAARYRLGNLGAERELRKRWRPGTVGYAGDPSTFAGLALLRAAGLWKGPLVGVIHPNVPTGFPWRRILRGYDVVIALSRVVQRQLVEQLGRSEERTLYGPWGPDLDFGHYTALEPTAIAVTGKASRDIPTLMAALREVDAPATVHLRQPPLEPVPANVRVVVNAGVAPYLGVLEDLRRASVVAIPYDTTQRLVGLTELNDALALGKPVVITKSAYVDVEVESGGFGREVGVRDVAGWVAALNELTSDLDLNRAMGRRARAYAEERWNARLFGEVVVQAVELAAASRQ